MIIIIVFSFALGLCKSAKQGDEANGLLNKELQGEESK